MSGFATYLDSLIGSWRALAAAHADARVVVGDGYVAARFAAEPILENALLFDPARLSEVQAVYCGVERYAIWTSDAETANAAAEAGFVRDEVTVAMVCPSPLGAWPEPDPPTAVERTDVDTIADLNQVSVGILRGVPGARAYATADAASGALLIEVGTDVNVSFVATKPERSAAAVSPPPSCATRSTEAHRDGFATASLQATTTAMQLYRDLGFLQVGLWQEWVPADRGPSSVGTR